MRARSQLGSLGLAPYEMLPLFQHLESEKQADVLNLLWGDQVGKIQSLIAVHVKQLAG